MKGLIDDSGVTLEIGCDRALAERRGLRGLVTPDTPSHPAFEEHCGERYSGRTARVSGHGSQLPLLPLEKGVIGVTAVTTTLCLVCKVTPGDIGHTRQPRPDGRNIQEILADVRAKMKRENRVATSQQLVRSRAMAACGSISTRALPDRVKAIRLNGLTDLVILKQLIINQLPHLTDQGLTRDCDKDAITGEKK